MNEIKLPELPSLPDPDDTVDICIAGRFAEVDAFRPSTVRDYAREYGRQCAEAVRAESYAKGICAGIGSERLLTQDKIAAAAEAARREEREALQKAERRVADLESALQATCAFFKARDPAGAAALYAEAIRARSK